MKARLGKLLPPIASVAIIAIAALVLWRKLAEVDPLGVAASFAAIPGSKLVLAGLFTAGGLLALALIAVTFNTIRLQVLTQRDEIEVIKLIGATDAFIRRPFLYYGTLQGCAGGMVAWLIVSGGVYLLNRNLGELSHVYASLFQLKYLTAGDTLSLLLIPATLGWFGAWLSVGRNLALNEPVAYK